MLCRGGGKAAFVACSGLGGVHQFGGVHLQTLWDLKRNQAVVIRLDAFHQFVKLEIVAVQIHSRPCCRGSPPPHQSTLSENYSSSSKRIRSPSISKRTKDSMITSGYSACNWAKPGPFSTTPMM